MNWKVGDWVVFERSVGQIKELRDDGCASFSDGHCETFGMLTSRFRQLTLRNKRIAESFDAYYTRLNDINGEAGFNYPDISRYFSQLALDAIDAEEDCRTFYDKAQQFVFAARNYNPIIDGVNLFRPNPSAKRA